jgi:mono/diheme cytochrome c family protein
VGKRKSRKQLSRGGSARASPTAGGRSSKSRTSFLAIGVVVLAIAGVAAYVFVGKRSGDGPTVDVRVPELSSLAQRGARAFEASCAGCHGSYAAGTATGPPLVHRFYEPSHHGDSAIRRAARLGVQPHHWRFGPMPKVDVSDRQLEDIVAFVRELQRANGIR